MFKQQLQRLKENLKQDKRQRVIRMTYYRYGIFQEITDHFQCQKHLQYKLVILSVNENIQL